MKTQYSPPWIKQNKSSQDADNLFWATWRRIIGVSCLLAAIGGMSFALVRALAG